MDEKQLDTEEQAYEETKELDEPDPLLDSFDDFPWKTSSEQLEDMVNSLVPCSY